MKTKKMKRQRIIASLMGCLLFCGLGIASADPIKWADNGHYYELVNDVPAMSWEDARDWAFELNYTDDAGQLYNGHLATITSAQENDFIESLPFSHSFSSNLVYFLGGYQTPTTNEAILADRKADWHWVTDEEWIYTSWRYDAPNNGVPDNFLIMPDTQSEEYLIYIPAKDPPPFFPFNGGDPGGWDDARTDIFTDEDSAYSSSVSWLIVEYEPAANAPDPGIEDPIELLVVTTEGKDVTADWSLMPEASSYTLYYAYADYKGDVDLDTLGSIEMGQATSIYVPNLPSGSIFYIAILAHTDQGDVLSNIVRFMPFGGTVTYPEGADDVLMQLDDPGGIGNVTVSGSVNGDTVHITQITGDDGSGSFVLTVVDDKPVTYVKGDLTLNFTWLADGSVTVQSVQLRAIARAQDVLDCQERINRLMTLSRDQFEGEYGALTNFIHFFHQMGMLQDFTGSPVHSRALFLMSLFSGAREDLVAKAKKEKERLEQDLSDCSSTPAPEPVTPTEIAMAAIDFDYECPTIPGAIYKEFVDADDSLMQYFVMNDGDPTYYSVGIFQVMVKNDAGNYYLAAQRCNDIDSKQLGWQLYFFDSGQIHQAAYYSGDKGINYLFYPDGLLNIRSETENGNLILYRYYRKDGTLSSECTGSECS